MDFFTYDFAKAKKDFAVLAMRFPLGFYVNDCLDRQALLSDTEGDTAAYLLADADRYFYSGKTDSAIFTMEQAHQLKNNKAAEHILFLLGNYYEAGGRWDKAAAAYEQYGSTYPDGLYIDRSIFNLAEIYYEKADRPEEADLLFQKLVSDFPASPLIEKARSYLNRLKSS
jgi:tetratricopeptide (TPR) repeat protein